jgi:hypothetical protein
VRKTPKQALKPLFGPTLFKVMVFSWKYEEKSDEKIISLQAPCAKWTLAKRISWVQNYKIHIWIKTNTSIHNNFSTRQHNPSTSTLVPKITIGSHPNIMLSISREAGLKRMPSKPWNNSVYIVATVTKKHQHVVFCFFFFFCENKINKFKKYI